MTHVRNLDSILLDEALLAEGTPEVELLAPEARAARSAAEVVPGVPVSGFVPFSLSPNPVWWDELLRREDGERWSSAARQARGTQFVTFVGTVSAIGSEVVATDEDAASPLARFGVGIGAGAEVVSRASLRDPELRRPEILARERYPLSDVVLLAVPNEPVRDSVKALFAEVGRRPPKIVVYPPWFPPLDED